MTLKTAETAPQAERLNNHKQNRGQDFHYYSWKNVDVCLSDQHHLPPSIRALFLAALMFLHQGDESGSSKGSNVFALAHFLP